MEHVQPQPCSLLDVPELWLDQLVGLPDLKPAGLISLLQTCRAMRDRVLSRQRVRATLQLHQGGDAGRVDPAAVSRCSTVLRWATDVRLCIHSEHDAPARQAALDDLLRHQAGLLLQPKLIQVSAVELKGFRGLPLVPAFIPHWCPALRQLSHTCHMWHHEWFSGAAPSPDTLQAYSQLQELDLKPCQVAVPAVAHLMEHLPCLTSLTVKPMPELFDSVPQLAQLTRLRWLGGPGSVDLPTPAALARLRRLRVLELDSYIKVTSAHLEAVLHVTSLSLYCIDMQGVDLSSRHSSWGHLHIQDPTFDLRSLATLPTAAVTDLEVPRCKITPPATNEEWSVLVSLLSRVQVRCQTVAIDARITPEQLAVLAPRLARMQPSKQGTATECLIDLPPTCRTPATLDMVALAQCLPCSWHKLQLQWEVFRAAAAAGVLLSSLPDSVHSVRITRHGPGSSLLQDWLETLLTKVSCEGTRPLTVELEYGLTYYMASGWQDRLRLAQEAAHNWHVHVKA